MRQETRAAVSSLRTCKDKVRPDAADRTEMTQHPERQLSTMSAAWAKAELLHLVWRDEGAAFTQENAPAGSADTERRRIECPQVESLYNLLHGASASVMAAREELLQGGGGWRGAYIILLFFHIPAVSDNTCNKKQSRPWLRMVPQVALCINYRSRSQDH